MKVDLSKDSSFRPDLSNRTFFDPYGTQYDFGAVTMCYDHAGFIVELKKLSFLLEEPESEARWDDIKPFTKLTDSLAFFPYATIKNLQEKK